MPGVITIEQAVLIHMYYQIEWYNQSMVNSHSNGVQLYKNIGTYW